MDRFPHRTRDELIEHAKSLRKPVIDYFLNQFHDVTGSLHKVMKILKYCNTIFNPLWLKENHNRVTFIKTSASELLPFFGFPEFDEEFIKKFITEMPKIVQRAVNLNFDWEGIEDSRIFKNPFGEEEKKDWRCR